MTRARFWLVCGVAALASSCAAREPDFEADLEALTVCHDVVVEGIDVAEYQGAVDWDMVHASGREFGIARIADGNHLDGTFDANWQGMRRAGMVRGAYYFFRATLDAQTQAQHISDAVGVLGDGDLPVTIDVECMCPFSTPGHTCIVGGAGCATAAHASAVLMDLVDRVDAITGKRPMIYTSARVWDGASYMGGMAAEPASALWVPGYIHGCVAVASSWSDWQFWQYSDGNCSGCVQGAVPGVSTGSDCDRNRWNGTLAELRAFASEHPDAGIPDAGMPDAAVVVVDAAMPSDAGGPDATHVDIVRPDGSIAPMPSSGCGCHVTRSSPSFGGLAVLFALALSGRVFERRARRTAVEQLAKRVHVA